MWSTSRRRSSCSWDRRPESAIRSTRGHDARDPPETLTLACPDYRVVAVDTVPEFADPGPTTEQRSGNEVIRQLPPVIFVGAAILDQTRILSAWVSGESGTRFVPLDEDAAAFHTSS